MCPLNDALAFVETERDLALPTAAALRDLPVRTLQLLPLPASPDVQWQVDPREPNDHPRQFLIWF